MECGGHGCEICTGSSCSCSSTGTRTTSSSWRQSKVCYKCKEAPAQVAANQTEVLCAGCLNTSLFSKFKTAVNTYNLINPSDKVLLAFSGGPSSRVALDYIFEIWEKAKQDSLHCSEGSSRAFSFGVAYVDESLIIPVHLSNPNKHCEELKSIVMEGSRRPDEFVIISIEDVYTDAELDTTGECCSIHSNKLQRLQSLFKLVQDPTGKEDLLERLRMQALQQFARKHGYTRLVLGLSASRIAVKVISETAKGCGFSLPAGMQYYDGRWSVPVVLPLRDCIAKELVLLCHYRKLKWVFIPNMSTLTLPQKSITSLSSSFVSTLQEDNPSRERTIMRTAAKLQAFSFNHATAIDGHSSHKKSASVPIPAVIDEEEIKDELLCLLCCAPLSPQESVSIVTAFQITESKRQQNGSLISDTKPSTHFLEKCCQSCQYQFFPVEERTGEILSILPQTMKNSEFLSEKVKQMWMRSQINDCLLINSDSDDETVT